MIRLLFLNPVGSLGGAERVLLHLMRGLSERRPEWQLHLLTMGDGPLLEEASRLGVDSQAISLPSNIAGMGESHLRGGKFAAWGRLLLNCGKGAPQMLNYLRIFRQRIREISPTLVHSNGIKSHLLSRFTVPREVPITWHLHDFYSTRPLMGKLLRRASTGLAGAIAISEHVAKDAMPLMREVTPTVILNAVDTERFTPSPPRGERLDELAGFSPSHQPILRVGLVATYALWKGQRLFLEAAREFISIHPDALVRFYIVGGSIYYTQAQWSRGELEQIATSLGIRDRVGFVPFQLDTVAIYRDLDIMVHASTQPEPFGLTIAEAMSCGRAVIVANAGGASEIFSDGIDALGFTPGDRSSLVQCLSRLISDSALRTRLGQAARQSAERRFNLSRYFAECEAYFAAIIRQLRKMRRIESIEREG